MRSVLAWIVFRFGDVWSIVFDRWLPWGMPGPIYTVYSRAMLASVRLQGEGSGPWLPVGSREGWND